MSSNKTTFWDEIKIRGENIGLPIFLLGVVILLTLFWLNIAGIYSEIWLLGASLGLLSLGLGFTAIGMSAKSDRRHTELLKRLDRNVLEVLKNYDQKQDTIEPSKEPIVITPTVGAGIVGVGKFKVEVRKRTKEEAQKRLDEDTERTGHVRGEIYQLEDGSWGIHWGGKYPL